MLPTLKSISKLLNDENAPIKYYDLSDRNKKSDLFYLLSISHEKRHEYEALIEEEKKKYISDSAIIYIPLLNVNQLYDLHHIEDSLSYDYDGTIQMINKTVKVTTKNEKVLFAVFLILHEFGHWHDFNEKGKVPYFYNVPEEKERRQVFELKQDIMKKLDGKSRFTYKDKQLLIRYFTEYHAIPSEKYADVYAVNHLNDAYERIKQTDIL